MNGSAASDNALCGDRPDAAVTMTRDQLRVPTHKSICRIECFATPTFPFGRCLSSDRFDAFFVPGDSQTADALCNEARGIVAVLAFNLKGAGPKFSIVNSRG